MDNCSYEEYLYIEKLRKLKIVLNKLSENMLKQSYLVSEGICEKKIVYKRTTKNYTKHSGDIKKYSNTNAYLCYGSDRKVIKDSDLLAKSELFTEVKIFYNTYSDLAKFYCNSLNCMHKRGRKELDFTKLLEASYTEMKASGEYAKILSDLSLGKSETRFNAFNIPSELNNTFNNSIFNEKGERFRSKNEIIASFCLSNCGIYYNIEPFYPRSNIRADLGLFCYNSDLQELYIEIAGMRLNEKYENQLQQKRELARKNRIPLVIIDMTDYPDETGKTQTKFNFIKLSHIFTKLYFGLMSAEGQIITPY